MSQLITNTTDLQAICSQLATEEFITIDTEFIREKTYWPQLCLIQIAGSKQAVAVDPLAANIKLQPLWELLAAQTLTKVMHAARQDMEIFLLAMGKLPNNIFDTQIAAMVCGLGENISYENLINKLLNKQIDKSQRFTDWAKRPLTKKQIEYAIGDVTYLRDAYIKMRNDIEARHRMDWIAEEMQALQQQELYITKPEDAWQKVKFRANNRKQLGRLQLIAKWREQLAQQENVPRNRIMRDDTLAALAFNPPTTINIMQKMRGFPQHMPQKWCESLWHVIQQFPHLKEDDCPAYKKPKPTAKISEGKIELLKLLLKYCSHKAQVAPKLVADKTDIELLAHQALDSTHPILHGWRWEIFGRYAIELLQGNLYFTIDSKTGEMIIGSCDKQQPMT